jgi:hypothetical protein
MNNINYKLYLIIKINACYVDNNIWRNTISDESRFNKSILNLYRFSITNPPVDIRNTIHSSSGKF